MRKLILGWALPIALLQLPLHGQLTLSPYSRYGLGELTETNSIRNISMGGISAGMYDASSINRLNPASYGDIKLTTLDFSGYLGARQQKTSISTGSTTNGGVYNLSMAFSNNKGFAFVFGLSPGSTVGYQVRTQDSLLSDTTYLNYTTSYQASGGLNHFYLGTGVRFLKSFRAGVNATYNFGTLDYSWQTNFEDNNYYNGNILKRVSMRGWTPQVGLQFADTLHFRSNVDRMKDLEDQRKDVDAEIQRWEDEINRMKARTGGKNEKLAAKSQADIESIRAEEKTLRNQIDVLMQNEEANDEEIGKLQDKIFRLEKKVRNREKATKSRDKELNILLERARMAQTRAKTRAEQISLRMEEVKAGKLPATVEKKRSLLVRLGGTVQPSAGLNGTRLLEFNNTFVVDTLGTETEASVKVPLMYTAGITIGQPYKWTLGADIRMQDWSTFNYFDETNTLGRSMRLSLGAEWIPNFYEMKYRSRVAYRLGAYYHQSQIIINGEPLQEIGVSIGAGLPIGRFMNETQTVSRLNLGLVVGKSGDLSVQPLQELSVRFMLGVNLNDLWFRKWRLD